jgi:hypothetical protein
LGNKGREWRGEGMKKKDGTLREMRRGREVKGRGKVRERRGKRKENNGKFKRMEEEKKGKERGKGLK